MATARFTVKIKSGNWDFGSRLQQTDLRIIEGPINAGESANATVRLYKDGAAQASAEHVFAANDRALARLRLEGNQLAYEVEYAQLTSAAIFGGIVAHVFVPRADVK